jgi:hypothetical protein
MKWSLGQMTGSFCFPSLGERAIPLILFIGVEYATAYPYYEQGYHKKKNDKLSKKGVQ